jgi:hypothetical protein
VSDADPSAGRFARRLLESPIGRSFLGICRDEGSQDRTPTERQVYTWAVEACADASPHQPGYATDSDTDLISACPPPWLDDPRWTAGLDRDRQTWVTGSERPPAESAFDFDGRPFGDMAVKPRRALWTSTRTGALPWGWLTYLRSGADPLPPPWHVWRLNVAADARVYEIDSPAAWALLCGRYPAEFEADSVQPDWTALSVDWDAVHLPVGGLLTTQQVPVTTQSRRRCELRGWDAESTVWLRWCFTDVTWLADVNG